MNERLQGKTKLFTIYCAVILAAICFVVTPALAKTALTVYTAIEADDLKLYKKTFEAANPDIEIKWVRDSTGIITAKLLAEKNNPQADVVWGLAASSLLFLDAQGIFQSYKPVGADKLDPRFMDQRANPVWSGMDAWIAAFKDRIFVWSAMSLINDTISPISWLDSPRRLMRLDVS